MKRRVADIIIDDLADLGISQAFAVVGGGSMYLNNALGISRRIKTVYCHHEQACAMAADGYARYTCDKPALVCVTTGPGGTNALTGVAGAYLDSIPMIVISGQCRYNTSVPSTGLPLRTRGIQEFNIIDTVKTMTKYSNLTTDPKEIRREIRKAYDIAMDGRRGPVWIDIPQNVQNAMIEESDLLPPLNSPLSVDCTQQDVDSVLSALQQAKRPCILAGAGIRYSGNHSAFLDFLARIRIPVVTAGSHPDVLARDHELNIGAEGLCGQRAGNFVLQNADVVLVLGASMSLVETGWLPELFAPTAHIISVNVDPNEHLKPDLHIGTFIHADLSRFFARTVNASFSAPENWLDYAMRAKSRFDPFEGCDINDGTGVNPYAFWKIYSELAPNDALTCLGNSSCIGGWLRHGSKFATQRSFVNVNFGSMGDDITLAEGVAVASAKPVNVICGDGAFMMNSQELSTIMHNQLPIRMVVFSNGGYGALRRTWKRYFDGISAGCDKASGISFPSFEKLVSAYSIPYRHCTSHEELQESIAWMLSQNGPSFLEVDESDTPPNNPCVISRLRDDGTAEPARLEDMSPLLDRQEFADMMSPSCQ